MLVQTSAAIVSFVCLGWLLIGRIGFEATLMLVALDVSICAACTLLFFRGQACVRDDNKHPDSVRDDTGARHTAARHLSLEFVQGLVALVEQVGRDLEDSDDQTENEDEAATTDEKPQVDKQDQEPGPIDDDVERLKRHEQQQKRFGPRRLLPVSFQILSSDSEEDNDVKYGGCAGRVCVLAPTEDESVPAVS